jgi:hypothetical protein
MDATLDLKDPFLHKITVSKDPNPNFHHHKNLKPDTKKEQQTGDLHQGYCHQGCKAM